MFDAGLLCSVTHLMLKINFEESRNPEYWLVPTIYFFDSNLFCFFFPGDPKIVKIKIYIKKKCE